MIVDYFTCAICGAQFAGFPNNARPVKNGVCCDACNESVVIPARLKKINQAILKTTEK